MATSCPPSVTTAVVAVRPACGVGAARGSSAWPWGGSLADDVVVVDDDPTLFLPSMASARSHVYVVLA
uniref:Uncharacterized protein n=1 Tax=Oryza punctata TaxID=4537 RepID=A0A0E0JMB9_ORYPU